MRKYILIAALFAACTSKPPEKSAPAGTAVIDTVFIPAALPNYDSICQLKVDSMIWIARQTIKSLRVANDSLNKKYLVQEKELIRTKFKVTKAKYYVAIVDRNPSQLKFLKGWLKNRALAD